MFKKTLSLAVLGLISLSGSAMADYIPYGSAGSGTLIGTINTATYTFTSTGAGDITAYFYGSSAGYGSKIGLSIDGSVPSFSSYGLQDNSTAPGTPLVLGTATAAGQVLEFILAVDTANSGGPTLLGDINYYLNSNPSKNSGEQHIYSTAFSGGTPPTQGSFTSTAIPAGTYVAFEDIIPLTNPPSDLDYNDHQFVFTGVTASVPDGGMTIAMLGMACASLGLLRRKY